MVSTGTEVLTATDRDRILQAMAECCAEAGYEETTVQAVVERAGVSAEDFELYFAGKEDCALAALNKMISETLTRLSMVQSRSADAIELRTHETRAILELMVARPALARLAQIEARQGGSRRMREAYESAAGVLATSMARLGDGEIPATAARGALGGAEALVRRELSAERADGLPRLLPDFVYAALVPFVGQREALRQAKLAARLAAEEER